MEAVFLSKADVYNGNHLITKRDTTHELPKEIHYYDSYEMQSYLCESEDGKIGKITVSDKIGELAQGYVALVSMLDMHQIDTACKAPYTRYYISFDSSLLFLACSNASNLFNIFLCCVDVKYSRSLTPAQITTFVSIYNKHEHLVVRYGRDITEKSLVLEIFAYIYDTFYNGQGTSAMDSRSLAVITELINYIDANIAGGLSLERLIEYVNFSAFYLSRIFKRYTGTTLSKYIIARRTNRVKLSLKSQVPITTVSKEIGFSNYDHFYRTFKNITGINPAKYKEIMEKEK